MNTYTDTHVVKIEPSLGAFKLFVDGKACGIYYSHFTALICAEHLISTGKV